MAKKKKAKKAAGKVKATAKKAARKVAKPAKKKVQAVPAEYGTVTPHLIIRGAAGAIEFYKKAFGAKDKGGMPGPDGRLMHAEIQIGDSRVMLSDEFPEWGSRGPQTLGGNHGGMMIYTRDVDAAFAKAVAAGAKVTMPVATMFWGDRYGKLEDPYGHGWAIATHVEDVSPKEMKRRMAEEAKKMGPPPA